MPSRFSYSASSTWLKPCMPKHSELQVLEYHGTLSQLDQVGVVLIHCSLTVRANCHYSIAGVDTGRAGCRRYFIAHGRQVCMCHMRIYGGGATAAVNNTHRVGSLNSHWARHTPSISIYWFGRVLYSCIASILLIRRGGTRTRCNTCALHDLWESRYEDQYNSSTIC